MKRETANLWMLILGIICLCFGNPIGIILIVFSFIL